MAKKSNITNSEKKNMSSTNDALAALGLADEAASTAPEQVTETVTTAEPVAAAEREEVEIGSIETDTIDFIPTMKRGGGGTGSKYKFEELAAPVTGEDGKTKYSLHRVFLKEGTDELKLKRSVQSATTQENKKRKDEGKYYITRTIVEKGEFKGMMIIRTDAPPAEGEDEAASE
jgi:hypothetical protein